MNKQKRKAAAITALASAAVMLLTSCNNDPGKPSQTGGNTTGSANSPVSSDWQFSQMAMGGGGYMTGVFSTSEEGLYYARTDVGGAYRFDKDKNKWVSISYNISEDDVGLMGIDGMAIDPDKPGRIFLLAGTSYFSGGKSCVMISEDYGNTYETVDVTELIKVHGNGMGRQNGERIAMDPVDHNILYVGGRTGGMIKSTDGGKTWAALTGLSDVTKTETGNSNGICTIVIDPDSSDGSKCTRIYAGISKNKESNIFVSEDGGESWKAVADLPDKLFPQRMRLDGQGNLIITYGNAEGPWNSGQGGIRRLNITSGAVEDISPANQTFGDVAIDPNDPKKMVAVTECVWMKQPNNAFGDVFYTTTDGGATWNNINDKMTMSSDVEWVKTYAMHWCGCLAMDKFNSSKIKVTSGNGLFGCDDIWADAPNFYFDSKGIEETVPSELVTVPGGKIVTSIYDYDGFVNSDAFEYGTIHSSNAGSMTDIAVAFGNTDVMVKCGGDGKEKKGFYYTTDGGKTWKTSKTDPINNAKEGTAGVTADGKRFFWSPKDAPTIYYSDDMGDSWNEAEGIFITNDIVCDTVNPDYVYAASGSGFYVSSDKGKTFKKTYNLMGETRITVVPEKEGVVYLPSMGLQRSEDHGENFARIETVAGAIGVGVGKGKDDSSPDAIYIWGRPTADDAMGVYWSDDGAKTWSAVTSSTMQFGGMGNGKFIKGDCSVYGRCYLSSVGLGVIVCDLKKS